MVIPKLRGGLGNQMFQIATAIALAIENDDNFAIDLNSIVTMQGNPASMYRDTVFKRIPECSEAWRPVDCYKEEGNVFKPIPYSEHLLIDGYFQSDKYFLDWRDDILHYFTDEVTIEKLRRDYGHILTDSVSVHVRRGDYLQTGDVMPDYYYYRALNTLWETNDAENILVFSDDIEWCEKNLFPKSDTIHFIKGLKDYEDMYLMSICSHNVTSNSSFSWWASYLNQNPNKGVYMPRPWTKSHGEDIYYSGVTVINR